VCAQCIELSSFEPTPLPPTQSPLTPQTLHPQPTQVLLDDPDIPGYQPALPEGFDLEQFAKEVAKEKK